MINKDCLVHYFDIDYPGLDEIAVYPDQGTDHSAMIAFRGNRATAVEIPLFDNYIVRYTPCVAWRLIPNALIEGFLTDHIRTKS